MGNKDLLNRPHKTKGGPAESWWYEENDGIEIHVRTRPHTTIRITWRAIRNALKRKDK